MQREAQNTVLVKMNEVSYDFQAVKAVITLVQASTNVQGNVYYIFAKYGI